MYINYAYDLDRRGGSVTVEPRGRGKEMHVPHRSSIGAVDLKGKIYTPGARARISRHGEEGYVSTNDMPNDRGLFK
jgi:hypothetical protein